MGKGCRFLLFSFFLITGLLFFVWHPANTSAQVPGNTTISCDNVDDPEFHSLRPYQANTRCTSQTANEATFCGNNLTVKETITQTYPGSGGSCVSYGNQITCSYKVSINHPITIDLSNANLPIMGNTEDVKNSQSSADSLNDADKVNEYVSWYLNGITGRAEYGDTKDTEENAVNFSGPIQKLLPGIMLDAQRINTINSAGKTNHNQIAVCAKQGSGSFAGSVQDILGLGKSTPTECYQGNNTDAQNDVYRLRSWEGDLSFWNNGVNKIVGLFSGLVPNVFGFQDFIQSSIANHWNKRVPPLPWENDPFASPTRQMTNLEYRKYYNEWNGKTCVLIPTINFLICLDNVLVPNKYADLFAHIPLSSTEDVEGQVKIDSVSSASSPGITKTTVSNVNFSGQAASLFVPHLVESDQLGSLLQNTYSPKGQDKLGNPTNIASGTSCNSVEVRSNDGDDLFATQITGNLSYTASFSCTYNVSVPTDCYDRCIYYGGAPNECRADCMYPDANPTPAPIGTQECKKDIYIGLSTTSKIPLVEDIWSRLVAGPMAVFKRIFPKTNTEGSVGQIMDIPGSTNTTYSGANVTQADADLKIPHIGGMSEYFLKGIQTALRPKGLGETIVFADNSIQSGSGDGQINCNQAVPEIAINGLDKIAADNLTKIWYASGPGRPYFKECNNDVIQRAQGRGIDPLFVLAIWIHESDASNYEAKSPIEDFGIHGHPDVPTNDFSKQLDFFLNLPVSYASACGKKDMATFVSMYWFGKCSPTNQEQQEKLASYISDLNFIYSIIAPGITLPNYPN